jgi:hypothetical protein
LQHCAVRRQHSVSEEHITTIFRVEKCANMTQQKEVVSGAGFLLGLLIDCEYGDIFL